MLHTLQIKYCFLQGSFWMLFCVGIGYVNTYLTGIGLSTGEVGITVAVFGAISALLQPFLGKLADRHVQFGWKRQLQVMLLLCLGCYVGLLAVSNKWISGGLFGLILLLMNAMMPFVNGAAFYYEHGGKKINFGMARGCGSLFYAVISMLLGQWVTDHGVLAITISGIAVAAGMFAIVCVLPYSSDLIQKRNPDMKDSNRKDDNSPQGAEPEKRNFVTEYPRFCGMLLGFTLLLLFHNSTNTYMLQIMESIGGGNAEMGIVFALAGVLELPVMFGFAWIIKRCSAGKLLVVAGAAFTLKGVVYLLAQSVGAIYGAQFFQIFSFALFAAASVYYSNEVMKEKDKLRGQALVGSSITLGGVLGNLSGGILIQEMGLPVMLWVSMLLASAGTILIFLLTKGGEKNETGNIK